MRCVSTWLIKTMMMIILLASTENEISVAVSYVGKDCPFFISSQLKKRWALTYTKMFSKNPMKQALILLFYNKFLLFCKQNDNKEILVLVQVWTLSDCFLPRPSSYNLAEIPLVLRSTKRLGYPPCWWRRRNSRLVPRVEREILCRMNSQKKAWFLTKPW